MRARARHIFRFKIAEQPGEFQAYAKVIPATRAVHLVLTADHVRRSIKLKGVGNTQTCSMAVCAKSQAKNFPHPVEGYIDWQYSRAYVVSKVSRRTGLPSECVVYRHGDDIAKLNDTTGGQQTLLKELEAYGDRVIRLSPQQKKRYTYTPRVKSAKDGSRSSRPAGVGARLRFAMSNLGGFASSK